MKTITLIVCAALAAGLSACDRDRAVGEERRDEPRQSATPAGAPNPDANNTRRNERDREGQLTPGDQGENELDRTTTAKIRRGVMADDTLSFTAKNIKIITKNGVVTLKGPVKNEQEKQAIAAIAASVVGTDKVDNQIEYEVNSAK